MQIDRVKLIAEMARQRMTVKRLSELSGASRVTITSVRAGKYCSDLTGNAIARALGVDVAEIIETEKED